MIARWIAGLLRWLRGIFQPKDHKPPTPVWAGSTLVLADSTSPAGRHA